MRLITLILFVLLAIIQYPLWLGNGSWRKVKELEGQLLNQNDKNLKLSQRNAQLQAEVDNLKGSSEAIEERARLEANMMKADEVFIQLVDPNTTNTTNTTTTPPPSTPPLTQKTDKQKKP